MLQAHPEGCRFQLEKQANRKLLEGIRVLERNDGFDYMDEISDSDNRSDGHLLADKFDDADSPVEYQISKGRSLAWVKSPSRNITLGQGGNPKI